MTEFKCNMCGGAMLYSIHSDEAVCENCGTAVPADAQELARIRSVYQSAERKMRLNSVDGVNDALHQFLSISNVREVPEQIALCENRLAELKAKKEAGAVIKEQNDKNDKNIGIVILVLILCVLAFAVGGAVYIVWHLIRGDLSATATVIIVALAAVSALLLIINNIRA